jgi:hypothetical protein
MKCGITHISCLLHALYLIWPAHMWWRVQIMKLPLFIVSILLSLSCWDPNILVSTLFWKTIIVLPIVKVKCSFVYFRCTMEFFDNATTVNTSLMCVRNSYRHRCGHLRKKAIAFKFSYVYIMWCVCLRPWKKSFYLLVMSLYISGSAVVGRKWEDFGRSGSQHYLNLICLSFVV